MYRFSLNFCLLVTFCCCRKQRIVLWNSHIPMFKTTGLMWRLLDCRRFLKNQRKILKSHSRELGNPCISTVVQIFFCVICYISGTEPIWRCQRNKSLMIAHTCICNSGQFVPNSTYITIVSYTDRSWADCPQIHASAGVGDH